MRRLFVAIDFPPDKGGIHDYAYGLVSHLPLQDTAVLAHYSTDRAASEQFDRECGHTVIRRMIFGGGSKLRQLLAYLNLLMQLVRLKLVWRYDELHFVNVYPVGVAGPFMKAIFGVKYYCYVHGLDVLGMRHSRKFGVLRWLLGRADNIVVNSRYTEQRIRELGFSEEQLVIIPPGLNTAKYKLRAAAAAAAQMGEARPTMSGTRQGGPPLQGRRVLITVARLVERKGHDMVIRALRQLADDMPELLYVICGDGPDRQRLEQLAEEYGVSGHVLFTGTVSDEQLYEWYAQAELFVMPSREIRDKGDVEGFGIVFLEANYHRLPVIGGRSGGIPDAVLDRQTGYLVDPLDEQELAEKIRQLMQDRQLARQMGNDGYDWVTKHCLWEHRIQLLSKLS
ncbi:glycosyltransferase family 4 protein [Paenibacillus sp. SYP-B4298]|uniref:glycosyltransferase family 4 protein n=1 Tax=Paenibacillus sp. SYP-B4298 TaxID=2996034 RepID=UPI0022DD4BB4|nr:glycosyltransferase family 4 protein [Paenibacillus sp. SYP-B4298]